MKRDLKADLELCNKATPGPWYRKKTGANFKGFSSEVIIADTSRYATGNKVYAEAKGGQFPANDADFIAQAREGWPHAIERALKAETLLRDILPMAMWVSCMYKNEPEANPNTHCCIWNEVVKRIQEVLGDE